MSDREHGVRIHVTPASNHHHGLPFSVVTTLADLIGAAYPDAVMVPGRGLNIEIPDARAPRKVTKKNARATRARIEEEYARDTDSTDPADTPQFAGWDGRSVEATVPDKLTSELLRIVRGVLDTQAAANYVELDLSVQLRGSDQWEPFLLTLARSPRQTPHALRHAAEQHAARLEELLAAMVDMKCVQGSEPAARARAYLDIRSPALAPE